MSFSQTTVRTTNPNRFTLAAMGRAAREGASTWTMREWAGKLAAQAPAKDYRAQLKKIYDDLTLNRWRYVMEPEEWTHGSGRSMIAHVLGTKYNSNRDPSRAKVLGKTWGQKGWGDCDDVSALVASAALSIGLTPLFRVTRWPGGSHVSVRVRLPDGTYCDVDPVGYPKHPFGWTHRPPGGSESLFDLDGMAVEEGTTKMLNGTYLSGPGEPGRTPSHVVLVAPGDTRGARVLGLPRNYYRLFRRGVVLDGCPAVDQFGEAYEYDASTDTWHPERTINAMGNVREWYRSRRPLRVARRKKVGRFFKRVGKVIAKVAKPFQKAVSKILSSKAVQTLASGALAVFGVPPRVTRGVLAREADLLKRGGRIKVAGLLATGKYKEAAKLLGRGVKAGAKAAMSGPFAGLGSTEEYGEIYMGQAGGMYPIAPVAAMMGLGAIDTDQLVVADRPTPGRWYRVKKGDVLFTITAQAYGTKRGTKSNLAAAKWINNAAANKQYINPSITDNGMFPNGRVDLSPKFAEDPAAAIAGERGRAYPLLWIPLTEGDEPPEKVAAQEPALPAPAPIPPAALPSLAPEPPAPAPAPAPEPMPASIPTPPMPAPVVVAPPATPIEPTGPLPSVGPIQLPPGFPTRDEVPSRPRAPVVIPEPVDELPQLPPTPSPVPTGPLPSVAPLEIPPTFPRRDEVPSRPRAPVVVPEPVDELPPIDIPPTFPRRDEPPQPSTPASMTDLGLFLALLSSI